MRKTPGGSGLSCTEPFAFFDRDSCSWRMSAVSLTGDCEEYSGKWPVSGMMRDGSAYALPMPEHLISARESSFLRGLPTPRARDFKGPGQPVGRIRNGKVRPRSDADLPQSIKDLLPTPAARDGKGKTNALERGKSPLLTDAVKLPPTPNARDGHGIPSKPENWQASLPRSIGDLMQQPCTDGN